MFIAIIGTPSSGKQTILEYLEKKYGFKRVRLEKKGKAVIDQAKISGNELDQPMNELRVSSSITPTPSTPLESSSSNLTFTSHSSLLDFITRNWLSHHVTTDLTSYEEIEPFVKRPFFLCVSIDGPILVRYEREKIKASETGSSLSLEEFIQHHDTLLNGSLPSIPSSSLSRHPQTDFKRSLSLAQISICNNFPAIQDLEAYLDRLNLVDEERLRPGWDTYFMTLASLASHRSNCMKRRVGALLVRSKRILSTGYNGTPRGTKNCNMGGCRRCNGSARGGEALDECLCLHAEENALLEAGRERIGDDSVIYCNTCPCLRCSVKIVQCGVREVVYNQSYSMDEASAAVLKEGGVILRQLHMPGQL
ncbi:dCMP deaminase [Kwoniella mangroviensis CBS 8886]|nr:dCMP deaminase [Kwoniella mangroviensis CBS 8886]